MGLYVPVKSDFYDALNDIHLLGRPHDLLYSAPSDRSPLNENKTKNNN